MTIVARPLDNPLLDARLTAMREKAGCRIVSKRDAARTLLKTLRAGGMVGILADQRARPPDGIAVPFFGRPALTTTSIARLAEKTGALFLPVVCLRIAPGRYRLVYSEPLDVTAIPPEERGGGAAHRPRHGPRREPGPGRAGAVALASRPLAQLTPRN